MRAPISYPKLHKINFKSKSKFEFEFESEFDIRIKFDAGRANQSDI